MGYFQVRYDSRVVNYDRRCFIRLATDHHYSDFFFRENRSKNRFFQIVASEKKLARDQQCKTFYYFFQFGPTIATFLCIFSFRCFHNSMTDGSFN